MNSEQLFFLRILSDYLNTNATEPALDIDWQTVYHYAHLHQVVGIVFYQCKNFIPKDIKDKFEQGSDFAVYYHIKREETLKKIDYVFKKADIPYIIVKGLEVAKYYPVPALRTMGDLDILVHKTDKERAGRELLNIGFLVGEKNPDYDWTCKYNGLKFELHHQLIYQETVTKGEQERFFNNFWKYTKDGKLDRNFHFLFLLVHLRKHIMNLGAGFRMFMDLAAIIQKENSLDWRWIEEKLQELQLFEFSCTCFNLINKWFEIKAPVILPEMDENNYKKLTEQVFTNGIFGYGNEDNEKNSSVNQLTKQGKVTWKTRLGYFSRLAFPNYNNMANSPYYHFVRGHAWLLPVAWIWRTIRLICGKTNSFHSLIKRIMTPQTVIERRTEELKMWGLNDTE